MSKYSDYLEDVRKAVFEQSVPVEGGFRVLKRNNRVIVCRPSELGPGDLVILRLCRTDIETGLTSKQWNMIQECISGIIAEENKQSDIDFKEKTKNE